MSHRCFISGINNSLLINILKEILIKKFVSPQKITLFQNFKFSYTLCLRTGIIEVKIIALFLIQQNYVKSYPAEPLHFRCYQISIETKLIDFPQGLSINKVLL